MKFTDKKTRIFTILFIVLLVLTLYHNNFTVKADDPNFGYETIGASNFELESVIAGSVFLISESGTADSITVALKWITTAWTGKLKCAIYLYIDLSLVGATEERTIAVTSTYVWYVFNFSVPKPSLTANTEYILVVWAQSATGYVYVAYNIGETDQGHRDPETYTGNFPNPLLPTVHNTDKYSIYCSYTVGEEKTWNNAETWKLNLYTLKWFASELWKINLHNFGWFNVESWLMQLHNYSWFLSENWLLYLHNFSWFDVENWKLGISSLIWNLAEIWKINIYSYNWFISEIWNLHLHNYSWFNIESWKIQVSSLFWNLVETWKINIYTYNWFISEIWKLSTYSFSWLNVETWLIQLHNFAWFTTETWKLSLGNVYWYIAEIWSMINLIIPVVSINVALLYSILAIMIALVAVVFALSKREEK